MLALSCSALSMAPGVMPPHRVITGSSMPNRASGLCMDAASGSPLAEGGKIPLPANIFEEPPPITWGSEGWNWGSAIGEAHNVAARVREEFAKPHRRSALIAYCKTGSVDLFDVKMVLALSCQRARNLGYDEPDGRWESLMDEMAAGDFEEDNMIIRDKLADAVNTRLDEPCDWRNPPGSESWEEKIEVPSLPIAYALEKLEFVKNGL